ncbi:Protein CBG27361 [Caenorhabditis briggsae]|uniref:Protein CBG27361 n=1 Tax=Caenorhabditis briggsae TaxID=6238 RepID=B6IGG1_CAEBR|nr:Protein CBG27361 [Caenorhabditis briggsae]CAR98991.1 Protein CBG27361 [Caenorhabditis briggsae]
MATDESIVFKAESPQPIDHYLKLLTENFEKIAPNATQEQMDLFIQLKNSVISSNIHSTRKTQRAAEQQVAQLSEYVDIVSHQLEALKKLQTQEGKQSASHSGKAVDYQKVFKEKQAELRSLEAQIREVNEKRKQLNEKNNTTIYWHEVSLKQSEQDHHAAIAELHMKIKNLQFELEKASD